MEEGRIDPSMKKRKLTIFILLNLCTTFQKSRLWLGNLPSWWYVKNINQAFFMGFSFFFSGYFVHKSFELRKEDYIFFTSTFFFGECLSQRNHMEDI